MKKENILLLVIVFAFSFCGQSHKSQEKENLPQSEQSVERKFTSQPQQPFTDLRDGKVYHTVKINDQIWLAQNLNFYIEDGSWVYDDDPENEEKFGRLYSWEAAKIACPHKWHLPSDEEWKQLADSLGGYHDGKNDIGNPELTYKELVQGGSSGFSALLGGMRIHSGDYYFLGQTGLFWSTAEYRSRTAIGYNLYSGNAKFSRFENGREYGHSCRCIRN